MSTHQPSSSSRKILFASVNALGWATCARHLQYYSERDKRLDTTHVLLGPSRLLRLMNHEWKLGSRNFRLMKQDAAWSAFTHHRLKRIRQPLRDFNLIHFCPGNTALFMCQKKYTDFTISLDATLKTNMLPPENHVYTKQELDNEERIYQSAKHIIALSPWNRESLIRDYRIPAQRISVFAPCGRMPVLTVEQLDRRFERKGLVRLLFVGNDWERKGGPKLLAWHQNYWKDRAELIVVSSRAVPTTAKNVRWLGKVENEKLVHDIFPSADMFVFPTLFDKVPNVLTEAIVSGLPIVATRIAGIPWLVQDGNTGFLADYGDDDMFVHCVEKLMRDVELRRRMSHNTLTWAQEEMNGDKQYGGLVNLLHDLANQ